MKNQVFSLLLAATVSTFSIACNDEAGSADMNADSVATVDAAPVETGVMVGGANMDPAKNIVENAANSSDHTTLVAAVKAAGLAETLSGAGPFTVFAPTNAAFDKLPAGAVDDLLKPENKAKLTSVLTYHVVPGSLKAADLTNGQKLKTVQGEELTVTIDGGTVKIDGATVTTADVISSNGVTHVVDAVVMPKN